MSLKDNEDLKYIKKHYGEDFAKMCRTLFPTLLEQPGLLKQLIADHLAPTKSFMQDMKLDDNEGIDYEEIFKNFIYSFVDVEQNKPTVIANKSAKELFDEAGYILYPECQTEEEIQSFKKYYEPSESLCTFRGGRLDYCRVWFAVKKNVSEIKRENFDTPKRQDEYGTSVISIQYTKKAPSSLSIKNRYNHSVNNSDATFGNNLDNIIPGLKNAMERDYNIQANTANFEGLDLYPYLQIGGKLYRMNFERDNIVYGSNNIILDNFELKTFDRARYIVVEKYIIDKKEKTIVCYNNTKDKKLDHDAFTESIGKIKSIQEKLTKNGREIVITPESGENIIIGVNDNSQIISYKNHNITKVGDNFLTDQRNLQFLDTPNLKVVGNNFLASAIECSAQDEFPLTITAQIEQTGDEFFRFWYDNVNIDLSHIKKLGNRCFQSYKGESLFFPELEESGHDCFRAPFVKTAEFPNLKIAGINFLRDADRLITLKANNLVKCDNGFLVNAYKLQQIEIEKITEIKGKALFYAPKLTEFFAPNLEITNGTILHNAPMLKIFYAPQLEVLTAGSLGFTPELKKCVVTSVKEVENGCLCCENKYLKELILPNTKIIRENCFANMLSLEQIDAPELLLLEQCCFQKIPVLKKLILPKTKNIHQDCFADCELLDEIILPQTRHIGAHCFTNCSHLAKIEADKLSTIDEGSFHHPIITELNLSSLEHLQSGCFSDVPYLRTANLPWLITMQEQCFKNATALTTFNAPDLQSKPEDFLCDAINLKEINCPIKPAHMKSNLQTKTVANKNDDITL